MRTIEITMSERVVYRTTVQVDDDASPTDQEIYAMARVKYRQGLYSIDDSFGWQLDDWHFEDEDK